MKGINTQLIKEIEGCIVLSKERQLLLYPCKSSDLFYNENEWFCKSHICKPLDIHNYFSLWFILSLSWESKTKIPVNIGIFTRDGNNEDILMAENKLFGKDAIIEGCIIHDTEYTDGLVKYDIDNPIKFFDNNEVTIDCMAKRAYTVNKGIPMEIDDIRLKRKYRFEDGLIPVYLTIDKIVKKPIIKKDVVYLLIDLDYTSVEEVKAYKNKQEALDARYVQKKELINEFYRYKPKDKKEALVELEEKYKEGNLEYLEIWKIEIN